MIDELVNETLSEEELQLVSQLRKRKQLAKEGEAIVQELMNPGARQILAHKLWSVSSYSSHTTLVSEYKYENSNQEDAAKVSREKLTNTLIKMLEDAIVEQGVYNLLNQPI